MADLLFGMFSFNLIAVAFVYGTIHFYELFRFDAYLTKVGVDAV